MRHVSVAVAIGVFLAGAAHAERVLYSGNGAGNKVGEIAPRAGNKVIGTSKCGANAVTVDLTVDGSSVTGSFREKTGPRYRFDATRDSKGVFEVDIPRNRERGASSGGPSHSGLDDGVIHVRGTVNDGAGQITIEDTCLFKVTLTRK